jgi:hypothetical protein
MGEGGAMAEKLGALSEHSGHNWREVPMPAGVAKLPRDPRGYPIFFSVQSDTERPSNHKILNPKRRIICASERRCNVCGEKLGYWLAFLGGPMCVDQRAFADAPMHPECAEYSLRVCPFLATDLQYSDPEIMRRAYSTTEDKYASRVKPKYVVLYLTRGYEYRFLSADGSMMTFRPAAPKHVVYWRAGEALPGVPEDLQEVLAKGRAAAKEMAARY